jgi:hypothetical protein
MLVFILLASCERRVPTLAGGVRYKLLRFKMRREQPFHSNCCLAWCGSAADSWYDISEELSLRTSYLIPRYFSRGEPDCDRDFVAAASCPDAGRVYRCSFLRGDGFQGLRV